jgi:hypothetical protein
LLIALANVIAISVFKDARNSTISKRLRATILNDVWNGDCRLRRRRELGIDAQSKVSVFWRNGIDKTGRAALNQTRCKVSRRIVAVEQNFFQRKPFVAIVARVESACHFKPIGRDKCNGIAGVGKT